MVALVTLGAAFEVAPFLVGFEAVLGAGFVLGATLLVRLFLVRRSGSDSGWESCSGSGEGDGDFFWDLVRMRKQVAFVMGLRIPLRPSELSSALFFSPLPSSQLWVNPRPWP